jgi:hypothetical protein
MFTSNRYQCITKNHIFWKIFQPTSARCLLRNADRLDPTHVVDKMYGDPTNVFDKMYRNLTCVLNKIRPDPIHIIF